MFILERNKINLVKKRQISKEKGEKFRKENNLDL